MAGNPSNIVVVESPAKARTIGKYLGKDFEVLASYGHVRDLPSRDGSVDPENDFRMTYEVSKDKEKHVDAIARKLRRAKALYLATDPDREGEAISWHLCELLRERDLDNKPVHRVVFHEITRKAIEEAIAHPRDLSMDLVNAQQARRALDYLVGFNLSPLLWRKVRRGLSAGRVQSPALRLIVEREEEIEQFQPCEYWTIDADTDKDGQPFSARLARFAGAKVEQFTITDGDEAARVETAIRESAGGRLRVQSVQKKQRRRNPAPPFITSTLQQEAARKLGFTAQRTMRVAQQLYEGVETGAGTAGLITYMRTDSTILSADALNELRDFIAERYGADQVPDEPRRYKTSAKNAQEAHEAIRPTSVRHLPADLRGHLSNDQLRLYDLIWKRTVACQMVHATIDTVTADLDAGGGSVFRANGSAIALPGFMSVYLEGRDDAGGDDEGRMLPQLVEGETLALRAIRPEQHFTEPPPRYSEASLVKALEERGIGRPSTYASIISTLQDREYVWLDNKRFRPTDVGRVVNKFLTSHFTRYVDYDFTARLEDELDAVSRGDEDWKPLLEGFWADFKKRIEEARDKPKPGTEPIGESCPKCGSGELLKRLGRRGMFIGCSNYPDCDYTRNLDGDQEGAAEPETVAGRACPECGSDLVVKQGRYGRFIGCSAFPKCKYIEPLEKPEDTGVACPECGKGTLLKKKSRRGKIFYSCSTYPACSYAVWNPPLDERCPRCGWPVLTLKTTKRRGTEKVCPRKECGYAETVAESGVTSQ